MICPGCGCVFCIDNRDYPPEVPVPYQKYCSRACKRSSQSDGYRTAIRMKICAAREKQQYSSLEEAREAAGWLMLRKGVVTYPYECPCGWWHLSKQLPGSWEETG